MPHSPQAALTWMALAVPALGLVFGVAFFIVRLGRVRRRQRPDAENVLLGAVAQSLQERGQLAASLGELRTVHARLLDALPMGVLWVDPQQRVAALNRTGQELLGVTAGVVGLSAAFVLEPFPWLLEALSERPGDPFRIGVAGRRWRIQRIEAPDRVGALVQFEDVTEQEAEERKRHLRERFAELGEMTAGVAHQLKNGLAVIRGHAQLLQKAGHADTAQALLEEADDLGMLTQRFLQWAKPLAPERQPVRLEEVGTQVIQELQRRPVSQGRLLGLEGKGTAAADPQLLHQALVNLLENACQATPPGGRITVRVADGRLEVLDQGPGMGEETVARMLRPFESGRPDGTGLGLPLALKWINAFGAELAFELRPEGGTRTIIRW